MTGSFKKYSFRVGFLLAGVFALHGCTSTPEKEVPIQPSKSQTSPPRSLPSLEVLEEELGIERTTEDLGLIEKTFDPCERGYAGVQCGNQNLSVFHFRILCRASVGTVDSVTHDELEPLRSPRIKWKLGLKNGLTQTDREGFGQVRVLAPGPSRDQLLILISGTNSLGIQASEASQIIVPRNWCDENQ